MLNTSRVAINYCVCNVSFSKPYYSKTMPYNKLQYNDFSVSFCVLEVQSIVLGF